MNIKILFLLAAFSIFTSNANLDGLCDDLRTKKWGKAFNVAQDLIYDFFLGGAESKKLGHQSLIPCVKSLEGYTVKSKNVDSKSST